MLFAQSLRTASLLVRRLRAVGPNSRAEGLNFAAFVYSSGCLALMTLSIRRDLSAGNYGIKQEARQQPDLLLISFWFYIEEAPDYS